MAIAGNIPTATSLFLTCYRFEADGIYFVTVTRTANVNILKRRLVPTGILIILYLWFRIEQHAGRFDGPSSPLPPPPPVLEGFSASRKTASPAATPAGSDRLASGRSTQPKKLAEMELLSLKQISAMSGCLAGFIFMRVIVKVPVKSHEKCWSFCFKFNIIWCRWGLNLSIPGTATLIYFIYEKACI